jgi:hypothetical protein
MEMQAFEKDYVPVLSSFCELPKGNDFILEINNVSKQLYGTQALRKY